MKLVLIKYVFFIMLSFDAFSSSSLSYSGRLVLATGAPVSGPVNLRAELVYTNATSTVLCSKNLVGVVLTKGVFHLKLDLNCSPKTITQILSETPNGESVAIRIIDQSNSKTYPLQAIHSVPFSKVAEQLPQMGASAGQALVWDGSKWAPVTVGAGSGTVNNIITGTGLTGGPITTSGTISIAAGGVGTTELANNSVTAAKINAGEITSSHISATANIPYAKLSIAPGEIPQDRINGLALSMSALIEDVIADAVTGKAPSQNAVFDALNLKADRANLTQDITAASVVGLVAPTVGSAAANRDYVDNSSATVDSRITTEVTTLNTSLANKYDKAGGVITGDVTLNTQLLLKGGANFVTLKSNSSTASYSLTLPTSAGTNGFVLKTDGAGLLSWVDPTSISSGVGTVDSNSIVDNSIMDADINSSANIAQSKISNLVTDLGNKEPSIAPGIASQYWKGNKSWSSLQDDVQTLIMNNYILGLNAPVSNTDSLSTALGKLQSQINSTNSTKADLLNLTQTITAQMVTGLSSPSSGSDAANKTYVDNSITTVTTTANNKVNKAGDTMTGDLNIDANLKLKGTSNYVTLRADSATAAYTMTLPPAAGTNGQLLSTTGSGVMAWTTLPTCNAGEVLKSNGTSFSCVTDNTGAGAFSGTANRAVVTDATGALTTSALATDTHIGYLAGTTSNIQTQLNAKEGTVAAGTMVQYYRGDKSWQTLNGTAVANTAAGNIAAVTVQAAINELDTEKQASITTSTALATGSVTTNLQGGVNLNPFNTAAGNTGEIRFYELAANGTNYTSLKAPDALAANINYLMPSVAPSAGQVLSSSAAGVMSWISIPSAPVSSVFGRTGAVVATAGDYTATQVTNTAAGNIAAVTVQAAINELDTEKQGLITAGTTAQYYRGDKTWSSLQTDVQALIMGSYTIGTNTALANTDSLSGALGKIQGQINATNTAVTGKEGVVTAGTTSQYYRGDKTWQTLNGGAVANTAAGNIAAVTVQAAINELDTEKQANITTSTALATGSVTTNLQGGLNLNPFNTAAGNTGEIRFYELAANGSNYTSLKAPDALAANINYVMPSVAPTAGQVLSSSAAGVMSWISIPSAPVTTVFGRTGAVVATAGDYTATQVTNTAAGNITAVTVQAAINELDTEKQGLITAGTTAQYYRGDKTWSSLQTDVQALIMGSYTIGTNTALANTDSLSGALGKIQGQINATNTAVSGKEGTVTAGTTSQYYRGDKSWVDFATTVRASVLTGLSTATNAVITAADTLLVAIGKLQAQITAQSTTISGKADQTNVAQTITAAAVTGLSAPVAGSDATNKTYVDAQVSGASNQWTHSGGNVYRSSGNVGIGTASPRMTLDVNGTMLMKASTLNATATISFSSGNLQHTASNCGAFALHNLKDGGTYTFAVKGTTSATCSFTAFSDAGVTALTFHLPPGHGATTSGKHTLYTFLVMGGDVYSNWVPGL